MLRKNGIKKDYYSPNNYLFQFQQNSQNWYSSTQKNGQKTFFMTQNVLRIIFDKKKMVECTRNVYLIKFARSLTDQNAVS